jgi:hypothetical protein
VIGHLECEEPVVVSVSYGSGEELNVCSGCTYGFMGQVGHCNAGDFIIFLWKITSNCSDYTLKF